MYVYKKQKETSVKINIRELTNCNIFYLLTLCINNFKKSAHFMDTEFYFNNKKQVWKSQVWNQVTIGK
jgi:hypothetical protein